MTTRRAFIATIFGSVAARALPKPKYWAGTDWGTESRTVFTIVKMDYATKTVYLEPASVLVDPRQSPSRLDFINPSWFDPKARSAVLRQNMRDDYLPDGTRS